ncbi:MAG: HAMP domain-containing histidine kinase [Bacteroidetes Order II. Incertae sedis bacterium]|nr:HAMP domain-containing histidine kinase [Bacteroidetes Order II. bacterium]
MAVNTQVAKERPAIRHARHVSGRNTARESFGDFTQVISHRIGSLLSSIEGYTDLVLSSLDQREDRENAFRILEGVSRIEGVLHDLKHYQESLSLETHPVEASALLSNLFAVLADSELERVKLDIQIPPKSRLKVDSENVRQALLSVLRDAFEATSRDHLPVSFSADILPGTTHLRFRVYSPIPMADETIRTQIFKPFFTTKAANLGLGLTMARRIFRAHKGDVRLTSAAIEAGTEFTCTLPLNQD